MTAQNRQRITKTLVFVTAGHGFESLTTSVKRLSLELRFESLEVSFRRFKHCVLVESWASIAVEQLPPSVSIVVRVPVLRDVVVGVGKDDPLASVTIWRNMGCPDVGPTQGFRPPLNVGHHDCHEK